MGRIKRKVTLILCSLHAQLSGWATCPYLLFEASTTFLYAPRHDKTSKVTVRPAKTQISLGIHYFPICAATWQNQQSDCAPSEDSDQPGHPPSLIRVFAVRMKKAWVLSYPLSAQRRLRSDWADAQADLSLRWAHTLSCRGSYYVSEQ